MKKSFRAVCGIVFAALLATSGTVAAAGLGGPTDPKGLNAEDAFITMKSRTAAPFSHIMFCKEMPGECAARGAGDAVQLDEGRRGELLEVNRRINREIIARNDVASRAGEDQWSLAPTAGDCEDFAITKRHALIKLGWPSAALRLAIAHTVRGEGHLVLVVRTSGGDLVLDNLTDSVRLWNRTGLKWEMIQSSDNPRNWHRI